MRHGPAEEGSPSGSDAERDLTAAGRERVRAVAEALAAQNELPLRIFSSPLVRTLQTAELVAQRAGPQVLVSTRRELAPGGNALSLIHELRNASQKRIMLVGHEPDVTILVGALGIATITRGFMKGMIVGLSIPDAIPDAREETAPRLSARLRFVLDPKTLLWERTSPRT
jgi:phosphohistidine phosphatase